MAQILIKGTKQVIKYIKNMLEDGVALNDPRLPFINLVYLNLLI